MDDRNSIFSPQLSLKNVQRPTFNQTDIKSFATQRGFFEALVEEISITSANVNDGKADLEALPDNRGEVLSDSAYRGNHFRNAVRAKVGIRRSVATGMWVHDEQKTLRKLHE